jgi:class 3 adenylate cyclase/CheY-like chemotaxis protein
MFNLEKAEKIIDKKSKKPKNTVMIIDDEEPNLRQLNTMLSKDYTVIQAQSGQQGLEKLVTPGIATIVSDQRMSGMTGIEFFEEVENRQHPATRMILTGFAELKSVVAAINRANVFRYLTKPIEKEDLLSSVKQAVDHYTRNQSNLRLLGMLKDLMEHNAQLSKKVSQKSAKGKQKKKNILMNNEPKKIQLAIMFTDLRGFTKLTSKISPFKVVEILQNISENIHNMIYNAGGFVDKHLGDGIMAIFGLGGESGIKNGIHCMKTIIKSYPSIRSQFIDVGEDELRLGMGIASGEVVFGMLGTDERSELAIIGSAVNKASRLQEITKLALSKSNYQKKMGSFDNAMGICLPEIIDNDKDFKKVDLSSDDYIVRDFPDVNSIMVISS